MSSEPRNGEVDLAEEARERASDHRIRATAAQRRAAEARRKADAAGERQDRRESAAMLKLTTVRFPSEQTELRAGPDELGVGDTLHRDGVDWGVVAAESGNDGTVVATLRRIDARGR